MTQELQPHLSRILNPRQALSHTALRALSGLTAAQLGNSFAQAWAKSPAERRRAVTSNLVELAEDNFELDFTEVFKLCLRDPDAQVRVHAIEGLWENRERGLAETLLRMLREDPAEPVRTAAANSLGRYTYLVEMGQLDAATAQKVRDGLLAAIHDAAEVLDVRRRALEALAYISSDPLVHDIIATAYADPHPKMKASALFAMGRNCDARWLPTLLAELDSPSPEMRYDAACACGELEEAQAVPYLIPLLDDLDWEVQLAAVQALGRIGGDDAQRALGRCLRRGDEKLAAAAQEALTELSFGEDPLSFGLRRPRGRGARG